MGCSEWNDIRSDVNANCVGVYDNPADLNAKAWTVMRFNEVEENDRLEWLIRKDGCMHCAEPGCLKSCRHRVRLSNTPTVLLISNPTNVSVVATVSQVVRSTFLV